jgi:hypothetical protein
VSWRGEQSVPEAVFRFIVRDPFVRVGTMDYSSPSYPLCHSAMWASLLLILFASVTLASWPFPIPNPSFFLALCFLSPHPLRSPPFISRPSKEVLTREDMSRPSPRSAADPVPRSAGS